MKINNYNTTNAMNKIIEYKDTISERLVESKDKNVVKNKEIKKLNKKINRYIKNNDTISYSSNRSMLVDNKKSQRLNKVIDKIDKILNLQVSDGVSFKKP